VHGHLSHFSAREIKDNNPMNHIFRVRDKNAVRNYDRRFNAALTLGTMVDPLMLSGVAKTDRQCDDSAR